MNFICHHSKKRGFTLIELLVVITVIGVLMGLLLVGINGAREAARRTQCINNQKEVVRAILAEATSANGVLPGLVNTRFGKEVSWVVDILPGLGEGAWHKEYLKNGLLDAPHVKTLVCPSDSAKRNVKGALSYVVNCGEYDPDSDGLTAMDCGLFVDKRPPNAKKITIDEIKAGASSTIMLTENKDATFWLGSGARDSTWPVMQFWPIESRLRVYADGLALPSSVEKFRSDATPLYFPLPGGALGDIGFHWACSCSHGNMKTLGGQDDPDGKPFPLWINRTDLLRERKPDEWIRYRSLDEWLKDKMPLWEWQFYHARPSSGHPGIVVAAFADGRVDTINDDIDEQAYLNMCDMDADRDEHVHP